MLVSEGSQGCAELAWLALESAMQSRWAHPEVATTPFAHSVHAHNMDL